MSPPIEALDLADPEGHPRRLTVEEVVAVARERRPLRVLEEDPARQRPLERAMAESAAWVAAQVEAPGRNEAPPIYGINTGFGALAGLSTFRSAYQARVLSRNLLASHAAGVGPPLDEDVVRAAALIRARQLAQGHSGIRVGVVNRLLGILNARVYPIVPAMGSLGASGDLAPLAHLALLISQAPVPGQGDSPFPIDTRDTEAWVLAEGPPSAATTGSPEARDLAHGDLHIAQDWRTGRPERWRRVPGARAMQAAGGQMVLEAKEGLALTNGATFSTALAALALADAERILDHAEIALAMMLEAIRGFRDPFLPEVHAARGFAGAAAVAERVAALCRGSTLLDPASREADPVRVPPQDPYSLRCGPQVLGAAREALAFVRGTLETELNGAVDNPLIFLELPRAYKAVSGGNFHGAPIGYAMDLLKIVMADCASQSERRSFQLMSYRFSDPQRAALSLPLFLVPDAAGAEGLKSGLMIPQYTAASLVSAAKTLAHPDSVDSIPSSANQEDHVSMSMNAGLHARQLLAHAEAVVAIELLVAAQALHLRREQGHPGAGVGAALARLQQAVPPLTHDRALHGDIRALVYLMRSGALANAARGAAVGADHGAGPGAA